MAVEPCIVVLSGGSSSGKSTLARSMLDLLASPTVWIEADRALPSVAGSAFVQEPRRSPVVVLHRSAVAWLDAGYHVILDGALPYGDVALRRICLQELPPDRTFVVGVRCSTAELHRRERDRPERRDRGWAVQQAKDVNDGLVLSMDLDTSVGDATQHARTVLGALGLI